MRPVHGRLKQGNDVTPMLGGSCQEGHGQGTGEWGVQLQQLGGLQLQGVWAGPRAVDCKNHQGEGLTHR